MSEKLECPNKACNHAEEAHTRTGVCMEENCPCGDSVIMDERARKALTGIEWVMRPRERARRGFPTLCWKGCGNAIAPPSAVLCRECQDKITAKLEALAEGDA